MGSINNWIRRAPVRVALIGHRGTGKSSLLRRIEVYYRDQGRQVTCVDLDSEIESRLHKSISSIFSEEGEEVFRRIERGVFSDLNSETKTSHKDIYLAFGAGFDPDLIPADWHVLWVLRETDAKGRIFTDRPRLNNKVSVLEEFFERYYRRQKAYRDRANEILILDEGVEAPLVTEAAFFMNQVNDLQGAVTLLPSMFKDPESFEAMIAKRTRWGVRWFELRDDLLSEEQIETAMRLLPDERTLLSFRSLDRKDSTRGIVYKNGLSFDWPLEFGPCPFADPRYISLHERFESQTIVEALARFPKNLPEGTQLKAALPVIDFEDLRAGHSWWNDDKETRVFLPLSKDGRWSWYRQMQATRYSLNFFREGEGSGADQPTLLQWIQRRFVERKQDSGLFAAILGDPVAHSRTPLEQRDFFEEQKASIYAIRLTEDDWQHGALSFLKELGLRWAAVTSPHKERAYQTCSVHDVVSESLKAVNTLAWLESDQVWRGTNTDLEGLREAVSELGPREALGSVAVWGGGGTLNVIRSVAPEARCYSLRTMEDRDRPGVTADTASPDTLIWAVGRSHEEVNEPPDTWRPRLVIDLNYADDSPGRAFAIQCGARYVSGLSMFRHQAEGQRRFWREIK